MDKEELVRYIPPNYNYLGFKLRNIIETIVLDLIILIIVKKLHLKGINNIYALSALIPATVFCFMGIGSSSITEYAINFIRFLKKRRVLDKPSNEYMKKKDLEYMKAELRKGE